MTAHRILSDWDKADHTISDPGDAGAISPSQTGQVNLVTTGAETRTLAIPTTAGIRLKLVMMTDGGDCVVTVASAYDEAGGTTLTFANTGEYAILESFEVTSGTLAWRLTSSDGVTGPTTTAGALLSSSSLGTSDGGTVTQATNHSTGVTLNTNSGQITLASVDLAAGAEATFTVTNSTVSATDVVIVNVSDEQDASGTIFAFVSDVGAGAFDITLTNLHASTAGGNDASIVSFVVIQGASS